MRRFVRSNHECRHSGTSRIILGILLIGLGAMVLLRSAGVLPPHVENILFSWQMLLIALGAVFMTRHHNRLFGLALILIGGFFMLNEFANLPFNMQQLFWAFLFILLGLLIFFRAIRHPFHPVYSREVTPDSLDYIDEVNIFSGSDQRVVTQSFKGGQLTNIFGGSNYDFSDAQLEEGNNVLDIVSVFGGFKLIVPPDWNIKVEVTSILGGVSDKRTKLREGTNPSRILIIKGVAVFGGGEIKNF